MESAETIDPGNFKLRLNPLVVFGKDGADDEVVMAGTIGYGVNRHFDIEAGASIGDGVRFFGASAEFKVADEPSFKLAVIPGFHVRRGDRALHSTGIDLTFLGTTPVTDRLDFTTALDLAFERSEFIDYETAHLVPNLEYKLHEDVDLLVEFGIALNDDSYHYLSGGVAFYFR